MNLDEFRNTGLDFGEAPHPKGPKGSEVSPCLTPLAHPWDESGKRMVGFLLVKIEVNVVVGKYTSPMDDDRNTNQLCGDYDRTS